MIYRCGNCKGEVTQQPVKCTDGSLHQAYVCGTCGCTWFPWQIQRDLEWQRREDEREAKKRAKVKRREAAHVEIT